MIDGKNPCLTTELFSLLSCYIYYSIKESNLNIIKLITFLGVILFSINALASINCSGVPSVVKMGEFGAQESYVIVRIGGKDYRLGKPADDATKMRAAIVQTALVADKQVALRFYSEESCDTAASNRAIPNSVQLIK